MFKIIGSIGLIIVTVSADNDNNDLSTSGSNQLKRRLLGYPANHPQYDNRPGYVDIADDKWKNDKKDKDNFWDFVRNNNYEQDNADKHYKDNYTSGYGAGYHSSYAGSYKKDNKDTYRNNGWDKNKDYNNKDRNDVYSYKGYKSIKKDDDKNAEYYHQKYANYKVGKHDNNKDKKYADGKDKEFVPYHANSAKWDNDNNNYNNNVKEAIAILNVGDGSVNGYVKFEEVNYGKVKITAKISGLSPGLHGWHIHELGDLYTNGCLSTNGHFNPLNNDHGSPRNDIENRHIGDLGNIDVGYDGIANIEQYDDIVSLNGEYSIIGRAIVIHQDEDDLGLGGDEGSLQTGNAGARPACGVIGIKLEQEREQNNNYHY